ncbi:MAG: TOBE domain-containing protein [Fimbriimonadales bacterium]|nr:TOBE domain-containing protein [Fimbriimonadales bacterium]
MKHPDKLTRAEAAEALGVSAKTLASWEKSGRIPAPERDFRGWRLYDRKVIQEMRRKLIGGDEESQPSLEIPGMELSARNRLTGIVKEISTGSVICEVILELATGDQVASIISRSSLRRLGLRVGDRATAVIKSTDVMIAR